MFVSDFHPLENEDSHGQILPPPRPWYPPLPTFNHGDAADNNQVVAATPTLAGMPQNILNDIAECSIDMGGFNNVGRLGLTCKRLHYTVDKGLHISWTTPHIERLVFAFQYGYHGLRFRMFANIHDSDQGRDCAQLEKELKFVIEDMHMYSTDKRVSRAQARLELLRMWLYLAPKQPASETDREQMEMSGGNQHILEIFSVLGTAHDPEKQMVQVLERLSVEKTTSMNLLERAILTYEWSAAKLLLLAGFDKRSPVVDLVSMQQLCFDDWAHRDFKSQAHYDVDGLRSPEGRDEGEECRYQYIDDGDTTFNGVIKDHVLIQAPFCYYLGAMAELIEMLAERGALIPNRRIQDELSRSTFLHGSTSYHRDTPRLLRVFAKYNFNFNWACGDISLPTVMTGFILTMPHKWRHSGYCVFMTHLVKERLIDVNALSRNVDGWSFGVLEWLLLYRAPARNAHLQSRELALLHAIFKRPDFDINRVNADSGLAPIHLAVLLVVFAKPRWRARAIQLLKWILEDERSDPNVLCDQIFTPLDIAHHAALHSNRGRPGYRWGHSMVSRLWSLGKPRVNTWPLDFEPKIGVGPFERNIQGPDNVAWCDNPWYTDLFEWDPEDLQEPSEVTEFGWVFMSSTEMKKKRDITGLSKMLWQAGSRHAAAECDTSALMPQYRECSDCHKMQERAPELSGQYEVLYLDWEDTGVNPGHRELIWPKSTQQLKQEREKREEKARENLEGYKEKQAEQAKEDHELEKQGLARPAWDTSRPNYTYLIHSLETEILDWNTGEKPKRHHELRVPRFGDDRVLPEKKLTGKVVDMVRDRHDLVPQMSHDSLHYYGKICGDIKVDEDGYTIYGSNSDEDSSNGEDDSGYGENSGDNDDAEDADHSSL